MSEKQFKAEISELKKEVASLKSEVTSLKTTGHQKTELIRQQIIKSIQNK
jgi:hypothetical protein